MSKTVPVTASGPELFVAMPGCVHIAKVMRSDSRVAVLKTYELALKVVMIGRQPDATWFAKDGRPIDAQTLIAAKTQVTRCGRCNAHARHAYMCIQCSHVACDNHGDDHMQTTNHIFAVNSHTGDLMCLKCQDAISHPYIEAMRIKTIRNSGLAASYPGLPVFETDHNTEHQGKLITMTREPCYKASLGLRGFINMGSTCFMSAVLQCTVHNPFIKNYYFSGSHLNCEKGPGECLSCALNDIIKEFYTSNEIIGYGPVDFLTSSWKVKKSLAGYSEQDAHEFWQFLIHQIHKSDNTSSKFSKNKESTPSFDDKSKGTNEDFECDCITHKTFAGKLNSTLHCKDCGESRSTVDPMLDLSLEIKGMNDIHSALKKFTNLEDLEELYSCVHCKKKTKVSKQLKIAKLPPILTIQLKRFEHFNGQGSKIDSHVQIPLVLSMEDYVTEKSSMLGNGGTYQLFGIVVHIGSVNTGHYIAYVKKDGMWFKFDDSTVTRVTQEDVLSVRAYLLFYCINEFI